MVSPKFTTCLVVCFLASILSCKNNQQPSDRSSTGLSKEEVLSFLKKYDSAWNTKQNKIVDSLLAKQYVYFTSVGGISTRARNLEILAADYYKVISASRTEIDVFIDGNTAVVSSRWKGNGLWKGEPFNDNQRCGLVIQKQADGLKLLSESCVEITSDTAW